MFVIFWGNLRITNQRICLWLGLTMDIALFQGLEIVLVVSITSIVLMPVLLWVLPDRLHPEQEA